MSTQATVAVLSSWADAPAKRAIVEFVERAASVPADERLATFDNDGTLWCEKPMPIQLDFILRRLVEMAEADPALLERQPWKAAIERDTAWLAAVVAEHYAGDDRNVKVLAAGILAGYAGMSVEEFEARSEMFLRSAQHPTLARGYLECADKPMVELLAYTSDERGGTITHTAAPGYLDDGPEKPVRIWSRTGRPPLLAAGNSNGDIPMLDFTWHDDKPVLRLLVLHDDAEREFAYTSGAEQALEQAEAAGWTVVSIKNDWLAVF
jgi:hypothetical protein